MELKDKHILESHNKSLFLHHFVCLAKYRRKVLTDAVEKRLRKTCQSIEVRYEIVFLEIGADEDHVHFLVQSVSTTSPKKIINTIESITAIEIFKHHPEVKLKLRGGKFWKSGYYVNAVGQYGNVTMIMNYVQNKGKTIIEYISTS
jgi:putative transposase